MADLSNFLGGLVSDISKARVNADLQSIQIAEAYAKDNLLKHFAVPRMRIENVELTIPIAIEKIVEKTENTYQAISQNRMVNASLRLIVKSLSNQSIPKNLETEMKLFIEDKVSSLDMQLRKKERENVAQEYSNEIVSKVVSMLPLLLKEEQKKLPSKQEIEKIQIKLNEDITAYCLSQLKIESSKKVVEALEVTIEAFKLQEMKPENMIQIKMNLSEHGMEWVKMENSQGEIIHNLLPE